MPDIDWLLGLQGILGELASLDRRLQSAPESVDNSELLSAAEKVEKLKYTGAEQGPWNLFYNKYSAILHPHLQARGLSAGGAPPAWNSAKAFAELTERWAESERKLETVKFVRRLYDVAEQLESGAYVSPQELRPLLIQMKEKAGDVLDLAAEHPQLPSQFARVRQRIAAVAAGKI